MVTQWLFIKNNYDNVLLIVTSKTILGRKGKNVEL